MKKTLILLIALLIGCTAQQAEEMPYRQVPAYNITEVGMHDNIDDCWLVIHDKVYDVTDFINLHPGGTAILEGCGTDATALFEDETHSNNARNQLDNYYVGELI